MWNILYALLVLGIFWGRKWKEICKKWTQNTPLARFRPGNLFPVCLKKFCRLRPLRLELARSSLPVRFLSN